MEIKQETRELRTLNAAPGHTLTCDDVYFTKTVYLGSKDSADNWREVSDEEASEILQRIAEEEEARERTTQGTQEVPDV